MQLGLPVVPIRFFGGLPTTQSGPRAEFPAGYGKQDYYIGGTIQASHLKSLPYAERPKLILDAINALGTPVEDEQPLPGDSRFAETVTLRRATDGTSEVAATIIESLQLLPALSNETQDILDYVLSFTSHSGSSREKEDKYESIMQLLS